MRDLTNGQRYTVAVRAVNAAGAGPAATVTASPVTTPGAPQRLRSEPGDAQVTLRWDAPTSDGGSARSCRRDRALVSVRLYVNPAAAVRGPTHVVTTGATPVLSPAEARRLLEAIDTGTLAGLRDRALVSVMLYSVARVSAVSAMRRQDYFRQERQGWLRLHEKGGTRHDVPAPHHRAAEALDDYLARAGRDEPTAALFQSVDPAGRRLTGRALSRRLVLAMIKRRAAAADLPPSTCCHTSRATGITAYLSNGGTLEHAQQIDRRARPPEDDEALRPDGGHDHRRRDRAHRDLGGGRTARRRSPRDVRAASRDGRAARFRVRHVGCRMARTLDSVLRLRLFSPGGWGVSAARRGRAAPTRVGALWQHTRSVRKERSVFGWPATFEERSAINLSVVSELDKASEPWGVKVLRYEIKNINPPQDVLAAMEKQMRAEREKRGVILTSEGQRDAAINTAEGEKQRTIKESEARRQQQINEAEAILAVAISAPGGVEATRLRVAEQYVEQFGELAQRTNTMILRPTWRTSPVR